MSRRGWRDPAYRALRIANDVRAVRNGTITKRAGRRLYGKATGRAARKLFR